VPATVQCKLRNSCLRLVSFFAHFGGTGIADRTVWQDVDRKLRHIAEELDQLANEKPQLKAIEADFLQPEVPELG